MAPKAIATIAAEQVLERMRRGIATRGPDLQTLMHRLHGGNGAWNVSEAYDAAECAGVAMMVHYGAAIWAGDDPRIWARRLERLADLEPTATVRTHERVDHQQFSTPWIIAGAVALCADPIEEEAVLEPSAGTGRLIGATDALVRSRGGHRGLRWQINEIAASRATLLRAQWPDDDVSALDAELIAARIERPRVSLVVMNPPFSRQIRHGATRRRGNDWVHVRAALRHLRPGGRLVCVTGPGSIPDGTLWEDVIRTEIGQAGQAGRAGRIRILASVLLEGGLYRKSGTNTRTRLTVLEHDPRGRADRSVQRTRTPIEDGATLLAWAREIARANPRLALESPEEERTHATSPEQVERDETPTLRRPKGPKESKEPKGPRGAKEAKEAKERHACSVIHTGRFAGARPITLIEVEEGTWRAERTEGDDPVYEPWRASRIQVQGAKPHPMALVWSATMGAAGVPAAKARPMLRPELVSEGVLSDAQLEAVVLCESAHAEMLGGGWKEVERDGGISDLEPCPQDTPGAIRLRQGAMIGDGTGVGKGRQIAAIIASRWAQGNERAVWCAPSPDLIRESQRDWEAIGGARSDVFSLRKIQREQPIERTNGVCFTSYATLRSRRSTARESGTEQREEWPRIGQLVRWLAGEHPDEQALWDGVIVFDEAHHLANALGTREGQQMKTGAWQEAGSLQGRAALELQRRLPNARVVYASATGATRVEGLAYAERLGLWAGEGEAWRSRAAFLKAMNEAGVAGLEVLARDLQMMGRYVARVLSYEGIEIEPLEHPVTPEQEQIYERYAQAFGIIWENLNEALLCTGVTERRRDDEIRVRNVRAKAGAVSRFEWTVQRFFGHMTSVMKIPTLLASIEKDHAEGRSAVVQLVSTGEAIMERRLREIPRDGWQDIEIDATPKEEVLRYLQHAFPVQAQESVREGERTIARPAWHEDGRPVIDPEAVRRRDALMIEVAALPATQSVLDAIIERFGQEHVAEITGRSRRVVNDVTRGGERRRKVQPRGESASISDIDAFMEGRKHTLVFSAAGREGRGFHNARGNPVDRRRVHYVLEAGWQAIGAIQGIGRTHRADQTDAPILRLVRTDAPGEIRFIATIMSRLCALGAITRAHRKAQVASDGNTSMFDPRHDLDGILGAASLRDLIAKVRANEIAHWSPARIEREMRLELYHNDGTPKEIPVRRFLNRMLSMPLERQREILKMWLRAFDQRIESEQQAGTLDRGIEWLRGRRFEIVKSTVLRGNEDDPAATVLRKVRRWRKVDVLSLAQARRMQHARGGTICVNHQSGRAAIAIRYGTRIGRDGKALQATLLTRPTRSQWIDDDRLSMSGWRGAPPEAWEAAWQKEVEETPTESESTLYLLTGLMIPVWEQIPSHDLRIRKLRTERGTCHIGRVLDPMEAEILRRAWSTDTTLRADDVWEMLLSGRAYAKWSGRVGLHWIRRMGRQRVELHSHKTLDYRQWRQIESLGVQLEIIGFRNIGIVPNQEVLERLMAWWPGIGVERIAPMAA